MRSRRCLRPGAVVINKSTVPVGVDPRSSSDCSARRAVPPARRRRVEPRVPPRGHRGARLPRAEPRSSSAATTRASPCACPSSTASLDAPDPRHRPGVGRDDQVRVERLPRHEGLVHQRDRQPVRGGRRRRPRGRARHGLRPAHRLRVPPSGPRLRRVVLPEGHRRAAPHGRHSPDTTSVCSRAVVEVNRPSTRRMVDKVRDRVPAGARRARRSRCGASRSRRTPTTSATRPRSAWRPRLLDEGAEVRAYDPAAGERASDRVPDLEVVADPYEACDDADVARRAHRVGRVPLARLRSCRRADARPLHRRRPQPARPRRHAQAGLRVRGRRPLMPPGRRHRRRRLPRLPPLPSASSAAGGTSSRSTTCSPVGSRTSRICSRRRRSVQGPRRHEVHPRRRCGRRGPALRQPREPAATTSSTRSRR